MQVTIKGHQTDVLTRWKTHIKDRLAKLDKFEDRLIKVQYVLTASHHHLKGNEICHITAKVPRKTINVKKSAETMMEAIDIASRILEKQVQKLYKDSKTKNRHSKLARQAKRNGHLNGFSV